MERNFKYKFLLFVLTGILISGVSVSAAIRLSSLEVNYDNKESKLSSNDVQKAIDELNTKINEKIAEAESICPEDQICTKTWNFDYTGDVQTFIVPKTGIYKLEIWGASGYGGVGGGYTSGNITLEKNMDIYVYVGPEGESLASTEKTFNGGGIALKSYEVNRGGGATDIRLVNGSWDDFDSLKSRIMVAGAGGANAHENIKGGAAGGLIGYDAEQNLNRYEKYNGVMAGSQTSGGGKYIQGAWFSGFGYGGAELDGYEGTGGSGYYGGGLTDDSGGSGGSSFISGHNGCDAIKESSTASNIVHTGQSIHYSGYKFTNTKMIDGAGYNWTTEKGDYVGQPQPDGTVSVGHTGNGYARITYYLES